jgi:hypothetical protein
MNYLQERKSDFFTLITVENIFQINSKTILKTTVLSISRQLNIVLKVTVKLRD